MTLYYRTLVSTTTFSFRLQEVAFSVVVAQKIVLWGGRTKYLLSRGCKI